MYVHTYFHAVLCVGVVKDESSLNSLQEEEEGQRSHKRGATSRGRIGDWLATDLVGSLKSLDLRLVGHDITLELFHSS